MYDINTDTATPCRDIEKDAQSFYQKIDGLCYRMFGYPANRTEISDTTKKLLLMHYCAPLSNNCGDINERGNYAMDSKDAEKCIVGLFAEKFGMGDEYWGYVTSGGSESNSCGVSLAFRKNPDAVLYYSQSAHYSVEKYAKLYEHRKIRTLGCDVLDVNMLFSEMLYNWRVRGLAANVVLTHGTTKFGECDDIDAIVRFLIENDIPHYVHVDAALFGGVPNGQVGAPLLEDLKARGVDSVCVSLHKYIGFPDVKSVFVSVREPTGEAIEYIGQHDTTVSGSRSVCAYALYNHINEQLSIKDENSYIRNVELFENILSETGIAYYRADRSNIFVIDTPSAEVCTDYQLSTFEDVLDGEVISKTHIIIFPYHKRKDMESLAQAIANNR